MSERKSLILAFFTSFFITLIILLFLMSLYWVDIKAEEKGFGSFSSQIEIEKQQELNYRVIAFGKETDIDLTPLDTAAGVLQQYECFIFPEDWRFTAKLTAFIHDKVLDGRKAAREKEFFKNAGLV